MRRLGALHAEWTKFRTVRGWVLGTVGAATAALLFLLAGTTSANQHAQDAAALPTGPSGEAVNDNFYFVHQALTGDGSITVSVTGLTGVLAREPGRTTPGLTPWAKTGILVKQSLGQGSQYAAMMVTGAHGVRMQNDFTHDRAGLPGRPSAASPRWLRLVRAGTRVTGYDSTDGLHWSEVGSVRLAGLATTVQVGLFTACPAAVQTSGSPGGTSPAVASGRFGRVAVGGSWARGGRQHGRQDGWHGVQVGGDAGTSGSYADHTSGGYRPIGGGFSVTGAGDIAPVVGGPSLGPAYTIENFLVGTFAGLIVLTVVAVQFVTAEYRRGLIGTTLAATPGRERVLAAKAAVVMAVAFAVGVTVAAVSIPLGRQRAHASHFVVFTVPRAVELRAVLGTGLLLATSAALALALGTLLRRGATAITTVIVTTVLPYLLAVSGVLPAAPAQWLLRLTPAAGFAVQQTLPHYSHVLSVYTPSSGYFPLSPWAGYAVLAGWTALALAAATLLLRRRDV
ncbi:ABC transporter permease subunit [Streptomyces camelliae]|uniref:ABC transporter permease subunit n=1 Tax=Streptomyces camelliae TaxID=3004093 RepID=A0ABY7NU86_9ACTN|nr:ABC transporter permease subunit [Streptomyces sp. HUAS 2-6]WBO61786.1 ABC transporter permease subunit [Streptomyces sp. HUAS 2-6]